jgi:hypothetical protein
MTSSALLAEQVDAQALVVVTALLLLAGSVVKSFWCSPLAPYASAIFATVPVVWRMHAVTSAFMLPPARLHCCSKLLSIVIFSVLFCCRLQWVRLKRCEALKF